MKATIKQIQGNTFAARANSNHWVVFDTAEKEQGSDAASGPMETVLMALGTCSAIDIVLMLKKMRARVIDFQIDLDAERVDEPPRVFSKVHLKYTLYGESIRKSDVERAIRLSIEKYCSVAGMVGKTAEITTSYNIIDT